MRAIQLLNSYGKYEKEYCGSLLDEVLTLTKTKAIEVFKEKGKEATDVDFLTPEFLELVTKQNELTEMQKEAREMFLLENDYANAKTLCAIYYTDCEFNPDEFEDYFAMYEFLMDTMEGFFLKHRNMSSSVSNGKNPLTTK